MRQPRALMTDADAVQALVEHREGLATEVLPMSFIGSRSGQSEMSVEILAPSRGVMVLQIDVAEGPRMPIARATKRAGRWAVRALLFAHEEDVLSDSAARQCLIEDLHEAFPNLTLTPAVN